MLTTTSEWSHALLLIISKSRLFNPSFISYPGRSCASVALTHPSDGYRTSRVHSPTDPFAEFGSVKRSYY